MLILQPCIDIGTLIQTFDCNRKIAPKNEFHKIFFIFLLKSHVKIKLKIKYRFDSGKDKDKR